MADRETIARVIHPGAFKSWQSLYDYCLRSGDPEAEAQAVADWAHGEEKEAALAKADEILASLRTDTPQGEDGITQEDREAAAAYVIESGNQQDRAKCLRFGSHDEGPLVQAFARHRRQAIADTERRVAWQPIETAPAATGAKDDRILVIGGPWQKPELVLPDGEWWRMRKAEGSKGTPTHWMYPPVLATSIRSTGDGSASQEEQRG